MADATTPYYGWSYPTNNADYSTWGATLNATLIAIDAQVHTLQTTLAPLASPTFTGVLSAFTGSYSGLLTASVGLDAQTTAGSNFGVRIRAIASGAGILQFTDSTGAATWGTLTLSSSGGNLVSSNPIQASSFVGNATSATTAAQLTTGQTIGMTGDVAYTSSAFNGTAGVTGTATLAASGVTAGTYYGSITVDAKGRVTGAAALGYVWAQQKYASGSASPDNLTASTWTQRTLTGLTLNTAGASLSANQITLAAGTYEARGIVSWQPNNQTYGVSRLRNVTDGATLLVSPSQEQYTGLLVNGVTQFQGQFTLATSKVVQVESWSGYTSTGGRAASTGESEIYVDLYLRKIG